MANLSLTLPQRHAQAAYFSFGSESAIPTLDGLRALAIVFVLFRHLARPFWSPESGLFPIGSWDLGIPMMNGWMGVDLFFVLSGFLITHQILVRYRGEDGRIAFGAYFGRRALRIIPAYYATLAILALGLIPYYDVPPEGIGIRLAWHLLFLQDYLPQTFAPVFWSLGVEEKFYLLAPFALLLVLRIQQRRFQHLFIGALALMPALLRALTALRSPESMDYTEFFLNLRSPFHLSFDGLAVGSLCALLYRDRERWKWVYRKQLLDGVFWAGAVPLLLLLGYGPLLDSIDGFDKFLLQPLLALVLGGGPTRFFGSPQLRVLARLAYALYLIHYPIIACVTGSLGETRWYPELDPAKQFLAVLPIYLAAVFLAAMALHFLVEKPFLMLRGFDRTATSAAAR